MNQVTLDILTDLRILMRQTIYCNDEYINLLLEYIKRYFDCTNISFNRNNMMIDIKIKKTSMKKAEDYSHSVEFYYPLICNSFLSFLNDDRIHNELMKLSVNNMSHEQVRQIIQSKILSLFNATTLLDNIVRIYL